MTSAPLLLPGAETRAKPRPTLEPGRGRKYCEGQPERLEAPLGNTTNERMLDHQPPTFRHALETHHSYSVYSLRFAYSDWDTLLHDGGFSAYTLFLPWTGHDFVLRKLLILYLVKLYNRF